MPSTEQSILVQVSPREAFEYVANYRNVTKFERHFSKVVPIPGPTYGLGTTLDARGWFHGFPVRAKLRTVEFDKNSRIVSRSVSGLKSTLAWDFSEEDGGTRVRVAASYSWPLPMIPKQVKEAITEEIAQMTADSLRELKRLLESGDHRRNEVDRGE